MTGSELKALRNGARMSVRELAKKLDVSIATIYGWESGHYPVPSKREAQCLRIFGIVRKESVQDKTSGNSQESLEKVVRKVLREEIGKAVHNEESLGAIRSMIREELQDIGRTLEAEIVKVGLALETKHDTIRLTPEVSASAREGDRYRGRCQEVLTGRSW